MNDDELAINRIKRYIVLIIYDITDNHRRYLMVKCLEQYGLRVQKSAFEAYINKQQYSKMVAECAPIIDPEQDSLRIYLLSVHTLVRSWGIGEVYQEDVVIF